MNHELRMAPAPRPTTSYTSSVLVEKSAPEELHAGEEFEYEVRITNRSNLTVESVVVVESLLSLITIRECLPPSQTDEPHSARWNVGPLYPGKTSSRRLRCVARKNMRFRSHTALQYSHGS